MVEKSHSIIIKATDQATPVLKNLAKSVDDFNKKAVESNSAMKGYAASFDTASTKMNATGQQLKLLSAQHTEQISKMSKDVALWGAAFTTAIAVGVGKLGEMGTKLESVRLSFEQLARQQGINAEELLAAMQTASAGTINNLQLMLSANKAFSLGVAGSTEEMTTLLEIARVKGRNMGLTLEQAFDDIVTGLGRGSAMILDNLGITLNLTEVQEAYARSLGKTAEQLTAAEAKQAIINAVVAQGKKELEANGATVLTNAEKYAQLKTSIANATQELGTAMIPTLISFGEKLKTVIQAVSSFVEKNQTLINTVLVSGTVLIALVTTIAAVTFAATKLAAAFAALVAAAKFVASLQAVAFATTSLSAAFATATLSLGGLMAIISGAALVVLPLATAFLFLKSALEENSAGQKQYSAAVDRGTEAMARAKESARDYATISEEIVDIERQKTIATENYSKAVQKAEEQISKVREQYGEKKAQNEADVASQFIAQEEKIKELETKITEQAEERKKLIKQQKRGDNSREERNALKEQIAVFDEQFVALQDTLAKEKLALESKADLAKTLEVQISEARRIAGLTDFERAVENYNKRNALAAKELNSRIADIQKELQTSRNAYATELKAFENKEIAKREELKKTLLLQEANRLMAEKELKLSDALKQAEKQYKAIPLINRLASSVYTTITGGQSLQSQVSDKVLQQSNVNSTTLNVNVESMNQTELERFLENFKRVNNLTN